MSLQRDGGDHPVGCFRRPVGMKEGPDSGCSRGLLSRRGGARRWRCVGRCVSASIRGRSPSWTCSGILPRLPRWYALWKPGGSQPTSWFSCKRGRSTETTMKPTTPPMIMIMIITGSMRAVTLSSTEVTSWARRSARRSALRRLVLCRSALWLGASLFVTRLPRRLLGDALPALPQLARARSRRESVVFPSIPGGFGDEARWTSADQLQERQEHGDHDEADDGSHDHDHDHHRFDAGGDAFEHGGDVLGETFGSAFGTVLLGTVSLGTVVGRQPLRDASSAASSRRCTACAATACLSALEARERRVPVYPRRFWGRSQVGLSRPAAREAGARRPR